MKLRAGGLESDRPLLLWGRGLVTAHLSLYFLICEMGRQSLL